MIADSLLLDTRQARYLGKLEIGTAMVKLQGRWFEPFLVKFPLVKIEKGAVTDGMVKEQMETWFGEREVIRPGEGNLSGDSGQNEVVRLLRGSGKETKERTEKPAKAEELLLRDILEGRFSPTTERYARLGLNAYQGNKAKEGLLRKGLIEVKDTPTRVGRIKLLLLTEKGKGLVESLGLNPNVSDRKGGPEHEYWKRTMADSYRSKGYQVIEEYHLGKGKTTDLVAIKDEQRIAIEIETGKSDAIYNIRKNLEAGFKKVLCMASDEKLRDKIENQLRAFEIDIKRVKVSVILRE